jgi:23S rRNA pseudouridine2605 synthase
MNDTPKPRKSAAAKTPAPEVAKAPEKDGERIAKVLARAGVASRREAERMIAIGQIAVNGKVIDSPALNVTPRDRITVDGKPMAEKEPARLWLYYKPLGLVTSASDEKGRETVFDYLPEDLPRVMTVGRLDLNSEGLLLLTNDGELKRKLELPSTGWLRKYRVRIKGNPTEADLDPLRQGLTLDGERFQPMAVTLDKIQGANAWLTVGLREGRNREIRRAIDAIGLIVNRLIRVSYGPFRLGILEPGQVEEVKGRVLREQLGMGAGEGEEDQPKPRVTRTRKTSLAGKPGPAIRAEPARPARPARAAGKTGAPRPASKTDGAGDKPYAPRGKATGYAAKSEGKSGPKAPPRPGARPPRSPSGRPPIGRKPGKGE